MFKGIKNNYWKSEAAVVVKNLLDMQVNAGAFHENPASSANDLVAAVWEKSPHVFDGRFGQRPHKVGIAAAALSNAVSLLGPYNPNAQAFALCLVNIPNEATANRNLYPFTALDNDIFSEAMAVIERVSKDATGPET